MKEMLSKYFSKDELACRHCQQCQVHAQLLVKLEDLRELVGRPIKVNSGYRCAEHNKKIGGSKNSQHVQGTAADLAVPAGMTLADFYKAADRIFKTGGVGVYPSENFIHVDVRPTRARWSQLADGSYASVEKGLS